VKREPANKRGPAQTPPPPTVPDLVRAPELAAVFLLEHALGVLTDALLAEHPTLIDDFAIAHSKSAVLAHADPICRRAATLRELLCRYRRAVRDATMTVARHTSDDDILFWPAGACRPRTALPIGNVPVRVSVFDPGYGSSGWITIPPPLSPSGALRVGHASAAERITEKAPLKLGT